MWTVDSWTLPATIVSDTTPDKTAPPSPPRAAAATTAIANSAPAPAIFRCGSSISRAMNSRMISLEPSKMVLMRLSRRNRSTGTGRFAARLQRRGGFVAAPAADLHRVIDDLPRRLRAPTICTARLRAARRHSCRDPPRLAASSVIDSIAKVSAAMRAILSAMAACLPMGAPHCTRSVRPVARNFQTAFRQADARRGQRQPAGVERRQRHAQAFAFGQQDIFARHADIGEPDDAVVKRPQAHEPAAVRSLPRPASPFPR